MSANPSEQRRGGERRGRQPSQRDRQLQERAGERQAIAESRAALAQQVLIDIDPQQDVEVVQTEDGPQVQLTDDAAQRQAEQLRQQAAERSDRFDESDFIVDRSGGEINVEPTQAAINRERRKEAAAEFESQSEFINNVSFEDVKLTDDGPKLSEEIIEQAEQRAQRKAQQQASQQQDQARRDFAEAIESGEAFSDLPDGVDPASLISDVDPQEDIVRKGDSLTLADDVQAQINSQLESDALQQQRREFANALESGEAFDSGEPPEGLGNVDPQSDITVEDGKLTLADEAQRDIIRSQLPASATDPDTDDLITNVRTRAADRTVPEAIDVLESQLPDGVGVRSANVVGGEVVASQLDLSDANRETIQQLGIAPRVIEDRNAAAIRIGDLPSVRAGSGLNADLDVSIDNNQQLQQIFRENVADVIDDDLPGEQDISADDIAADGDLQTELESLQIDPNEIGSDGLTEAGRDDLARQQLAEIQASETPISAATPADSKAFANVVAELGQELNDPSLTARQDVLADLPFGSGDINVNSATKLISQIDPQQAAQNDDIDLTAGQIRQAQQDIESQQQQLRNDPSAVLDEIVDRPDDFIERATLLNAQNRRGRARRSAAREQINAAEEALAADIAGVNASDVDLQLSSDAQGIGGLNDSARDAIQEQAAEPLPNFAAGDINVSVDDGQINTAVDESTLERTQQLQVDIAEQQARNEIADSNPNIDRGDIEVEAGEGVSPSDELVAETLGSDVESDVDSFEQLEQIQQQQQAQQQITAIDERIANQPIGPQDVQFREVDGGVVAELTPEAERRVDATRVDLESAIDNSEAVDAEQFGQVSDPNISDNPLASTPDTADQISSRLGAVSDSFSETAGAAVAQASLLPAIEQATLGTDRSEQAISGVVEGFTRVINPAEQVAAGAQLADLALTGPDGDISREFVGQATADRQLEAPLAGQSLDGPVDVGEQSFVEEVGGDVRRSFAEDPAESVGQTLGFIVPIAGSAAASSRVGAGLRSLRQASAGGRRGLGDLVQSNPRTAGEIADTIDDATPSRRNLAQPVDNRPTVGTGGRGSLLDADAVDAAQGVSEPGVVRRAIGDIRRDNPTADIRTRVDTAERAQIGLIPRRGADDAVEFADERLSANLRQQTITQRQRELDEATEGGTFEGEPAAFGDDARRAQAEADADAIARQERLADDATSAEVSEAGDGLSAAVSSAEAAERTIAAEQVEEPAVSADAQEPVAAAAEQQPAGEIEAEVDQFGTITEADVGEVTGSPTLTGEQTPVTGQTLFEVGEVAVTGTETAQQVSTIDDTAAAQSAEVASQNVEVGSFGDVSQELDQQQDGAVGIDIGSGAGIDIGAGSVVDVGSDTAVDTVLDVAQTEAAASATDQSAAQDTRLTDRLLDPVRPSVPRAPRTPGRPPTPPSIRISPEEDDDGDGDADGDGFGLVSLSAGVGNRGPAVGFVAEQLTAFATGGFGSRELPEQTTVPAGAELTTATLADPDPSEEEAVESVAETFGIEFDDETEGTLI